MIDKSVVVMMADHHHSLTSIARRFKVSVTRIWQIVSQVRRAGSKSKKTKCEICKKPIEKKRYVSVGKGLSPFLVCEDCRREIKDSP